MSLTFNLSQDSNLERNIKNMNKFILTLFSLILFTPSVFSETVLYCVDESVTGFKSNKTIRKFEETRFTLRFNDVNSEFSVQDPSLRSIDTYSCKPYWEDGGSVLTCTDKYQSSLFIYSGLHKKYTWFKGGEIVRIHF